MKKGFDFFCPFFSAFLFFVVAANPVWGQVQHSEPDLARLERLAAKVLRKAAIGKALYVDATGQKGCNKSKYVYLGSFACANGKSYKLMTRFSVLGSSCRGISRLEFYDFNNEPLGAYRFDMPYELPIALDGDELVFFSTDPDCPWPEEVRISLLFGLPEFLGSPCTGGKAPDYELQREK